MIDRIDEKAIDESVRQQNTADQWGTSSLWWNAYSPADDLLKPWGTKERDVQLRQYWLAVNNTLTQGAITNLIKRVVNTPWELSGGRNLTRRYQDLLQNAEFGDGWKNWLTKVLTDYFTQDFGGVIEVIGGGESDKPIRGPVVGLAQLDRHRCLATGDVNYPIVYFNDVIDTSGNRKTAIHRMHYTRVIRLTDMVSPIERGYGNGLCALSRIIGVTNAQILMGRYQNEKLSNAPPAGLITFGNVRPGDVQVFRQRYAADRQMQGNNTYAPIMEMQSIDPANPIEVNFIPFAQVPDHFNLKEYMESHVNLIALGLGEDPQEIWPLTGGSFGTGTQSVVLAKKGRAKAYADCLTMIERILNLWVLPESLEFAFKFTDSERDKEEAETAAAWMNVINAAPITQEQKLMLMANRIPAFADVLLDEAGNLRLPDDDVVEETTADDATALETQAATGEEAANTGAAESASADADFGKSGKPMGRSGYLDGVGRGTVYNTARLALDLERSEVRSKDYLDTQTEFIRNLTDLIGVGLADETTRRRFGTVMRAQIARLGRKAYEDGLEDGGVNDDLTEDDLNEVASIVADQSKYVSDFSKRVFSGDSEMTPEARAQAWAGGTLDKFYQAGLLAADANGMYKWVLGTADHCPDCKRLDGQVHRLKDFRKRDWMPRSNKLECKMGCKCELVKTKEKARGRF